MRSCRYCRALPAVGSRGLWCAGGHRVRSTVESVDVLGSAAHVVHLMFQVGMFVGQWLHKAAEWLSTENDRITPHPPLDSDLPLTGRGCTSGCAACGKCS